MCVCARVRVRVRVCVCVCVCVTTAYQKILSFYPLLELGGVEVGGVELGGGEGGGGEGGGVRMVKVGEKISLNVSLKSLAPKVFISTHYVCMYNIHT